MPENTAIKKTAKRCSDFSAVAITQPLFLDSDSESGPRDSKRAIIAEVNQNKDKTWPKPRKIGSKGCESCIEQQYTYQK